MKYRRMFVNPLDFKWSGTVKLSLFTTKREEEQHTAITPVLVIRDTPEARRLLSVVGSDLLTTLKKAERVVWNDRAEAAFHAYNTPAESRRSADKDKLVVALRAAIESLEP